MKISSKFLFAGLLLAATASLSRAQLISRSFDITGSNGTYSGTKVTAHIDLWLNLNDNTLVLNIDNDSARLTPLNANVGTITEIGFNTPFGDSLNVNNVKFEAKWLQGNGFGAPIPTNWTQNYWNEVSPFTLQPGYSQDYGVDSPTPNKGIEYGEKASFRFTFTNDITAANYAGFFDNRAGTSAFDITVKWQEVEASRNYFDRCDGQNSDKGGYDIRPDPEQDLPPTPEPSTYGLIGGAALLGLVVARRRASKTK